MFNIKRKILLLGDHPIVRDGIAFLINQEPDLEAYTGNGNGYQAGRSIANLKPDLVIIDISVDGKAGIDLIEEVASFSLPILVLSAYEGAVFVEYALRAGAKGYVLKREPTLTVVDAIRQSLNGRPYISKSLSATVLERFMDVLSGNDRGGGVRSLSGRELSVLQLVGEGMTTSQIGERLCVSRKTVETYRARIRTKLNIRTYPDMLQYAISWARSFYQP